MRWHVYTWMATSSLYILFPSYELNSDDEEGIWAGKRETATGSTQEMGKVRSHSAHMRLEKRDEQGVNSWVKRHNTRCHIYNSKGTRDELGCKHSRSVTESKCGVHITVEERRLTRYIQNKRDFSGHCIWQLKPNETTFPLLFKILETTEMCRQIGQLRKAHIAWDELGWMLWQVYFWWQWFHVFQSGKDKPNIFWVECGVGAGREDYQITTDPRLHEKKKKKERKNFYTLLGEKSALKTLFFFFSN